MAKKNTLTLVLVLMLALVANPPPALGAGSTAEKIIRENWSQLGQLRRDFDRDFKSMESFKGKVPASSHATFLNDVTLAVDAYEQRLYELYKSVPTASIAWLEQRTTDRPTGDDWNRLVRVMTVMKNELPVVREKKLVTPVVESARRYHGADGLNLIKTQLPSYYESYLQSRVRDTEAVMAADRAPYQQSVQAAFKLTQELGWDHPDARRIYGTAITRRWFGPGHDELVPQVTTILLASSKSQNDAVLAGMERLLALDLPKQTEFLVSLQAAYRDSHQADKADQVLDQLVAQNEPGAIRMKLPKAASPREQRRLLQKLADTDVLNGEEAWKLGKFWTTGDAGPRDNALGEKFKSLALAKEYPDACYETAMVMLKTPTDRVDLKAMRRYLEICWRSGNKSIAIQLWHLAANGTGGPKDTNLARACLLEAARQNVTQANVMLGIYHAKGIEGFTRNYAAALPYLQQGAAKGYPEPSALLGEIYLYGRSGSSNLREAYNLFNRAKSAGYWRNYNNPVIAETVLAALNRQVTCSTCEGSGKHTGERGCERCRGDGQVSCSKCNGRGEVASNRQERCASCRGSGRINFSYDSKGKNYYRDYKSASGKCNACNGRGNWTVKAYKRCASCGGDGQRRCSTCGGDGRINTTAACNPCGGDGKLIRYDSKQPFSSTEL